MRRFIIEMKPAPPPHPPVLHLYSHLRRTWQRPAVFAGEGGTTTELQLKKTKQNIYAADEKIPRLSLSQTPRRADGAKREAAGEQGETHGS